MYAAAVDRDLEIRYPVQIFNPHFDISFGCFVFGLWSLAFQPGCWALIVRFSLVGVGRSFLRLRGGLLWSIVRITADREWIVNMADEGKGNRALSSHPQYGMVCYHYIANYIPHSLPVEGGWLRPAARERST